eukprot:gene10720-58695_t
MSLAGWDPGGRPVLYSCFRPNADRDIETQLEHALCAVDEAVGAMPQG